MRRGSRCSFRVELVTAVSRDPFRASQSVSKRRYGREGWENPTHIDCFVAAAIAASASGAMTL